MKTCNKCNEEKNEDQFQKLSKAKDGLNHYCKKCTQEYQKEWRKNNERSQFNSHLKQYYNIDIGDYEGFWEEQEGVCAICGEECKTHGRLSVDHNHSTGKVRGLLCNDCNNGLGRFKDNLDILKKAVEYMEKTDEFLEKEPEKESEEEILYCSGSGESLF